MDKQIKIPIPIDDYEYYIRRDEKLCQVVERAMTEEILNVKEVLTIVFGKESAEEYENNHDCGFGKPMQNNKRPNRCYEAEGAFDY